MKKNTFKVLFYLRGNHVNKDGTSAIMIRISIDGEIEQLTSKLYVDPKVWDTKRGRANGRSAKILELNGRLQDIDVSNIWKGTRIAFEKGTTRDGDAKIIIFVESSFPEFLSCGMYLTFEKGPG